MNAIAHELDAKLATLDAAKAASLERVVRLSLRTGRLSNIVDEDDAAEFVRRVLRLGEFNIQAKRMGAVIRASSAGIAYWRRRVQREVRAAWPD